MKYRKQKKIHLFTMVEDDHCDGLFLLAKPANSFFTLFTKKLKLPSYTKNAHTNNLPSTVIGRFFCILLDIVFNHNS